MMNLAPERCSAPETEWDGETQIAQGYNLVQAAGPRVSVFAANRATRKRRMPAPHIESTAGEISKSVARRVVCMRALLSVEHFLVSIRCKLYNDALVRMFFAKRDERPA